MGSIYHHLCYYNCNYRLWLFLRYARRERFLSPFYKFWEGYSGHLCRLLRNVLASFLPTYVGTYIEAPLRRARSAGPILDMPQAVERWCMFTVANVLIGWTSFDLLPVHDNVRCGNLTMCHPLQRAPVLSWAVLQHLYLMPLVHDSQGTR